MVIYFIASSFVSFTNPIPRYIAFAVFAAFAVRMILKKPDK